MPRYGQPPNYLQPLDTICPSFSRILAAGVTHGKPFCTHDPVVLGNLPSGLRRLIPSIIAPGHDHHTAADAGLCSLLLAMTRHHLTFEAQASILNRVKSDHFLNSVEAYAWHVENRCCLRFHCAT
jgi:hypothetical protein